MSEAFFTELPRALSAGTIVLSAPASNSPFDGDCAMQKAISAVERCRKPVVVEIHGTCIGGGIDFLDGEVGGLVAACDIQCCSDASYFAVKEVDLTLAVDLGSLQRLPAIVGYENTTDRAMTGRRVTGSEAKAMGLVSKLFHSCSALEDGVTVLATELGAKSRLALMRTKAVMLRSRDLTVEQGLNSGMLMSHDMEEAISAQI